LCPEARVRPAHRQALERVTDDGTMITNVFTGRPARAIVNRLMVEEGPMSSDAPLFPLAAGAVAPLMATGSPDFLNMWSGQAVRLARALPAGDLTRMLAGGALAQLRPSVRR
jgi:nitronate monooxygenase